MSRLSSGLPGTMAAKRLHSSPVRFSTGVPVSARQKLDSERVEDHTEPAAFIHPPQPPVDEIDIAQVLDRFAEDMADFDGNSRIFMTKKKTG